MCNLCVNLSPEMLEALLHLQNHLTNESSEVLKCFNCGELIAIDKTKYLH